MSLEFSLLTFSPRVKNTKISGANKKFSKLTSKRTRLNSPAKTKKENVASTNVINVERKVNEAGCSIGQLYDVQHEICAKTRKIISSKGKENRIDSFSAYVLANASGHQRTSYVKNNLNSCHKQFSPRLHEGSFETNKNSRKSDVDAIDYSVSDGDKTNGNKFSSKDSPYITCSQVAELSTVMISESSYSSLNNIGLRVEGNDNCRGNGTVLVISDSSSEGTADPAPRRKIRHSSSRSRKSGSDLQKVTYTIVLDSSVSENDILEASCETPRGLYPNVGSSSFTNPKCRTQNFKKKKVSTADIKFKHQTHSSLLTQTKYKDIENWVAQTHTSDIGEGSFTGDTKDLKNSIINSKGTGINSSDEDILDQVYGSTWRQVNENSKKHLTEPRKRRKKVLNSPVKSHSIDRIKKQVAVERSLSVGSTDSEAFENFLVNLRQNVESTPKNYEYFEKSINFITDDDQDNSLGFYQEIFHDKVCKELKKTASSNCTRKKKNLNEHRPAINKELSFSSVSTRTSTEDKSNKVVVKTIEKN